MMKLKRRIKGNEGASFSVLVGDVVTTPKTEGLFFTLEGEFDALTLKRLKRRYGFKIDLDYKQGQALKPEPKAVLNPSDLSVGDLSKKLSKGEFDQDLEGALKNEKNGKKRKSALNAIKERMTIKKVQL